jgi:hypothetical protein
MKLSLIAILVVLSVPAHGECLLSAKAVWVAHPGSHATWRLRLPEHEGVKCWFARGLTNIPVRHSQENVNSPSRNEAVPQTDGQAPSGAREPGSILMWGEPMHIDETWNDIFARREHSVK